MAHIAKFKLPAMGLIYADINRHKADDRNYDNANIDHSRTHLNYAIKDGSMETLRKRLGEVSHTHRKDLVACCGVVITLPEAMKDKSDIAQRTFFLHCHDFLMDKFGRENCVYSVVHFDETTPHLHYGFVPVIEKERKYRSKEKKGQTYTQKRVCAHAVVTRQMLQRFHDELQKKIDVLFNDTLKYGVEVVSPDKEKRMKSYKHKSINQLKEDTIRQADETIRQAEEAAEKIKQTALESVEKQKEEIYADVYEEFKKDIAALQEENKKLEEENGRLKASLTDVKKIMGKIWDYVLGYARDCAKPEENKEIISLRNECMKKELFENVWAISNTEQEVQEKSSYVWDKIKPE